MPYFDLFNEAMNSLQFELQNATGLNVVTDPERINPPCVLINAPTWEAINWNVVRIDYPIQVITQGVGDIYSLQTVLAMCANILGMKSGVKDGRPNIIDVGGTQMPCYDITISVEASTK